MKTCLTCHWHITLPEKPYTYCNHPRRTTSSPDFVFAVLADPKQCGPRREWYRERLSLPISKEKVE